MAKRIEFFLCYVYVARLFSFGISHIFDKAVKSSQKKGYYTDLYSSQVDAVAIQ